MRTAALVFVATSLVSVIGTSAKAELIAGWSITTAISTPTTGSAFSYGAADQGALTAGTMLSGFHAQSSTAWTTPAGNGSTYSLSSDKWSQGDYYQIAFSTVGYESISVEWDQTRSGTGPSEFRVDVSVDGGNSFTTALSYSVIQAGAVLSGTNAWSSSSARQPQFTLSTPLLVGASDSSVILRFIATGLNLGAGTNRIDNISVTGNAIVPAPGAAALLGLAGLAARRRR